MNAFEGFKFSLLLLTQIIEIFQKSLHLKKLYLDIKFISFIKWREKKF